MFPVGTRLGRNVTSGQSHLNSDATIAHEGRPQGAPLPIVFSGRFALGRVPTRGAPTDCLLSAFCPEKGAHKGRPYRLFSLGVLPWEGYPQGVPLRIVFSRRFALRRAPTRGAPTDCFLSAFCPGTGHPQGVPLRIVFSRRFALGRAPTRGAPTDCFLSAFCPGKGTHKGCPYGLFSLGVLPWEGHPQGVPLRIVFSRRLALGRVPTRGAPTDCLLSAFCPGKGTHLRIVFSRRFALGRAPTRGAPTDCLLSVFWPGKGTHKGCPYRLFSVGVLAWGGHPQGVPLPDCLLSAFGPGKGTHKGRPYRIVFSRRFALGRAPTRGAPTDLSSVGPYRWSFLGVLP